MDVQLIERKQTNRQHQAKEKNELSERERKARGERNAENYVG